MSKEEASGHQVFGGHRYSSEYYSPPRQGELWEDLYDFSSILRWSTMEIVTPISLIFVERLMFEIVIHQTREQ